MERTSSNFEPLSAGDFAALGSQHLAYIRPVQPSEGKAAIGVFAADGRLLATVPTIEIAQALVRQNDLEPAMVH